MDTPHPLTDVAPSAPLLAVEKRLGLLLGHYDETFRIVTKAEEQRNRLFLLLLALLAVEIVLALNPEAMRVIALGVLQKVAGVDRTSLSVILDLTILNLFGYAIWLYLLINYYQRASYVRTYLKYLEELEEQMVPLLGPGVVTREGWFYSQHRQGLHLSVSFFYRWVFHSLMAGVLVARLIVDRPKGAKAGPIGLFILEVALSLMIALYSVQYLRSTRRTSEFVREQQQKSLT